MSAPPSGSGRLDAPRRDVGQEGAGVFSGGSSFDGDSIGKGSTNHLGGRGVLPRFSPEDLDAPSAQLGERTDNDLESSRTSPGNAPAPQYSTNQSQALGCFAPLSAFAGALAQAATTKLQQVRASGVIGVPVPDSSVLAPGQIESHRIQDQNGFVRPAERSSFGVFSSAHL